MSINTSERRTATAFAALTLAAHLALALPLSATWRGVVAHLLLMLPGALLAPLLFRRSEDGLARAFLALCGAIAVPPLLLLPIQAAPGPIPWWAPLLAADGVSVLAGIFLFLQTRGPRREARDARPETQDARRATHDARSVSCLLSPAALVLVLALAAALRLPFLGGAEFQGDEGRAVLMAADMLHGADDILLLHKKGPLEVLLPAGPLVITGHLDELVARLPFALAGVGAPLGAYLLARRMFTPPVHAPAVGALAGLLAALALALDGFMIGFSRIVQYQSALVLLACGALYCAWRFYEGGPLPRRYLLCAAALAAVALLAHFDALSALPALGWLVLAGAWRRRWPPARWATNLLPAALLGTALLAAFFVPFALHERFGRTLEYLAGRTGQGDAAIALYNNLSYYAEVATFYNTTFVMAALAAALAGGALAWLLRYLRPRALGVLLAALLATGVLLAALAPERLQIAERLNVAALLFGLPLAGLALAPRTPAGLRATVLWFGAGFLGQAFLVARPNTHFYVLHTAAALLAGLAVARLWFAGDWKRKDEPRRHEGTKARSSEGSRAASWLENARATSILRVLASSCLRVSRAGLIVAGVALLLLAVPYAYILFLRQEPEYRRTFPEHRPPIYRAAYGDEAPRFANFGFPHRAGWKAVGELYARGVIRGSYIANEEELITGWYLRGAFRCPIFADYVLLATHPLDRVRLDEGEVRDTYHLLGIVTTDGIGKMEIWSRAPVGAEPRAFELRELAPAFDERPVWDFPTQRSLAEVTPQRRLEARWPQGIRLVGYDLDPPGAAPGQASFLTLYWRTPLGPESGGNGYEPVVEVLDAAGRVAGTAEPTCEPPNREWHWQWLSGVSYRVEAPGAPPGSYTLRVSLRNPRTGVALPLEDGRAAIEIGALRVQQ
ncbi:MAG TPA: glycosyltransferase family 39 protein [Roseiflexaceae bacterium]|nr:glycosyltransferase family 39 protein [Roseiflexaceae bacterium]